jgi:uncharacterized protein (DUF983 family)
MRRFRTLMLRGVLLRCPSCGRPTLVRGPLRVNDRCRVCGLPFEHDEGFFLGALVLNYTVSFLFGILPAIVLTVRGTFSVPAAIGSACVASVVFPILFYWHAKSLWLASYYFFVPDDLRPSRWQQPVAEEDDGAPPTEQQQEERRIAEAIAALEGGRPLHPPGRH